MKNIKIVFNDGKKKFYSIDMVKYIAIPNVVIQNEYYKLVLNIEEYLKEVNRKMRV